MFKKRHYSHTLFIFLFPITLILSYLSSNYPGYVEKLYSMGFYRLVAPVISRATGIFPFSLGELILMLASIVIIYNVFVLIRKFFTSSAGKGKVFWDFFVKAAIILSIIYFSFMVLWGLNYHRKSFAEIVNIPTFPPTNNELKGLSQDLIRRANALRSSINQNPDLPFKLSKGKSYVLRQAHMGYDRLAVNYTFLKGNFGNPKPVLISKFMSYTGITGVYFPFTAEANVNTNTPDSIFPATTCHEMAHQRGFAREDEANYIAYLSCINHPDPEFQYSGTLFALIYSMNALYEQDPEGYKTLKSEYSEGVNTDLKYINNFWSQYEGPVDKLSSTINDAYLKSNLQGEGIYSYDRMVNLLVAEYRRNHK